MIQVIRLAVMTLAFSSQALAVPLYTTWVAKVEVDPVTDRTSCVITSDQHGTPIPMFHYRGNTVSVGVVGADFPGKDVSFRVDKQTAITEREGLSGGRAQQLVAQIRAGGTSMLVRSYGWPDSDAVTREFMLEGLIAELDKCKAAVR